MNATDGGLDVLLVEDDPGIRETLASILEEEDYRVATAGNGAEARSALEAGARPALILLDLMMPVESGWECAARLQGDPQLATIPVVLLSGIGDVHRQSAPLRADGYLRKPVDIRLLLEVVAGYCRAKPVNTSGHDKR